MPPTSPASRSGITSRALALGFVLSLLCGLLIPYLDHYVQGTFIGGQHLPPGAVFVLMVMVLAVNPLLRALSPRLQFTRVELVVVYSMLLVSTLVPGHGSESVFIPVSVSPFYFDTPAAGWDRLFLQHAPEWMHPETGAAITSFYEGLPPGASVPWGAWVVPLLAWSVILLALYLLATFTTVLLHPQWSEHEKLSYPLVALPMEMAADVDRPVFTRPFWRSPLMWIGFGLAVFLEAGRGLGYYYPGFSGFRLSFRSLHTYFSGEPLISIGWTPTDVYPMVVGVSALLRTELSGSLVFFYWFTKIQRVIASAFGYRGGGLSIAGYPLWLGGQPWGGYFAYVGMGLWVARRHLASVYRQLLGREQRSADQPIDYRICVVGIGVCLAIGTYWLVVAGMSVWSAFLSLVAYAVIIIVLTKVVAEAGLLFVQQTLTPAQMLNYFFGTNTVGARGLTAGMFFDRAFGTDLRATIAPNFTQGLKIAEEAKTSKRWMLIALWLAILGSLPATYASSLQVFYRHGGVNCDPWFCRASGTSGWTPLAAWLVDPKPANLALLTTTAIGAVAVWGMTVLRQRHLWFSLHPIGFIMMQTYPMSRMWLSIFIGWTLKVVILRYGGPKGLRRIMPGFLGLAFGDIVMMVFWVIVASITGKHRLFLLPG